MGDRDRAANARQAGHILYGALVNSPNARYTQQTTQSSQIFKNPIVTVDVNVTEEAEMDTEIGGVARNMKSVLRPLEGIFLGHIVSVPWLSLDPLLQNKDILPNV